MSLMSEIEKLMGEVGASVDYRIVNLNGHCVYIEGIKSVVSLDETEMQFQLKKGLIVVTGDELKVKYLDTSTCVITGQIKAVETR